MFFTSKIPIVARRRRSQLATTAPVLTPPDKPSTWFPGEGLVTQAHFCNLSLETYLSRKIYMCYLMLCLFCFESDSKFVLEHVIVLENTLPGNCKNERVNWKMRK